MARVTLALKKKPKARAPSPKVRERAGEVHQRLARAIPTPHVELHFTSAWQLMVAVILSAQSTDKMVNQAMPRLLEKWPDVFALAKADQAEVEEVIKSTGFFCNKAKAIRAASQALVERYRGEVPRTMDEMLELPGIARKSANVILGTVYGIPSGITVDTHAMRVSQRLGLTKQTLPEKIENDLCVLFPKDTWTRIGHRFVLHGRYVCVARSPRCADCALNEVCPSRQEEPLKRWQERADKEALEMASRAGPFTTLS